MVKNTPGPEPHRAIYGFSFNVFFTTLFILYVIWVLPYQALGYSKHFYFIPDTYFAFSCPVFVLCGMFFFLFFYSSINMAQTADIDSSYASNDSIIKCKCAADEEFCESGEAPDEVDGLAAPTSLVLDIDLSQVSKVLYCRAFSE